MVPVMKRKTDQIGSKKGTARPETTGAEIVSIVSIGASAGGLEAFSELLRNLPVKTGMAFVFVQHLDPHHSSQLVQILSPGNNLADKRSDRRRVIETQSGLHHASESRDDTRKRRPPPLGTFGNSQQTYADRSLFCFCRRRAGFQPRSALFCPARLPMELEA